MPNNNHGTDRFARASFEGKTVGGSVEIKLVDSGIILPCVQFTMSYGINAIPTAAASIPLGRNVTANTDSEVYEVKDDIKQMTKVEVRLKGDVGDYSPSGAKGGGGGREQWPAGDHLLFMGYVSGTSYRRTQGSVSLVVNFIHKLFDLASSSAGSADLVPGAPNSLVFPAFAKDELGTKAGNGGNLFTEGLNASIGKDFSVGIIDVLKEICTKTLQTHNAIAERRVHFVTALLRTKEQKKAGLGAG